MRFLPLGPRQSVEYLDRKYVRGEEFVNSLQRASSRSRTAFASGSGKIQLTHATIQHIPRFFVADLPHEIDGDVHLAVLLAQLVRDPLGPLADAPGDLGVEARPVRRLSMTA